MVIVLDHTTDGTEAADGSAGEKVTGVPGDRDKIPVVPVDCEEVTDESADVFMPTQNLKTFTRQEVVPLF